MRNSLRGPLFGAVALLMSSTALAQTNPCGLQLGGTAIFCDTFDHKNPGLPSRTGDLDPNVWGVSRAVGDANLGQGNLNNWAATEIQACNGTITVAPPNDVMICNGQLRQAVNDAHNVTVLAMYPKQPFDWSNRTGTVSFDVSNDTQGFHAAWPEFWITDTPVPAPFNHFASWTTFPRHGLGVRMAMNAEVGEFGYCPNGNNIDKRRWSVDSAIVIRNYIYEDSTGDGTPSGMQVNILDCVVASPGPDGPLNHVEIRVAQNLIEVWASDAGSSALRKIATVTNPNLSFTRGLVWIEDVHYNASKGACPPQTNKNPICQTEHTFTWDNVAFDGPFTYRDFSYDALDANQPTANGEFDLGKLSQPDQTASWNVLNMPANPQAAAVRVLFNFFTFDHPNTINVTVNGHAHQTPWPYPDTLGFTWRTLPVTIPITDLVPGTNVVQLGSDTAMVTANVNIVLVDVPGGVPVLPGSNNAYPASATPPPPTPTPPPASANCSLSAPAFCETFNQGPSAIRGRGGDLDPAKWATARLSGEIATSGQGTANPVPIAPVPQCRVGITQSSVFPPNDTLVCDPSGTKSSQLMTAVSMQNYGVNSYMVRQPFDFAGRTGKIVFDVDAVSRPLGGFVAIEITDDPVPATTFREFGNFEAGPVPKNGLMLRLADACSGGAAPTNTMVYNNYVGTIIMPTFDHTNGCATTSLGSLNHFEIQVSQNHIDVYGSDFSTDNGQTFPNYKLLYSANINLPFTRGYVHFSAKNHASAKYGLGPDAVFHWDNLGFDGPMLPAPRAYEISDNVTTLIYDGNQAQNLGYQLLDGTTGKPEGIYSPATKINALTFQNVNISGITSATLTLNAFFQAQTHTADTSWGIRYRFNSGTWRNRNLTSGDLASINAIAGSPWGELSMLIDVPVADLVQGTNNLELLPLNAPMDYPPVVANIDLLLGTSGDTTPTAPPPQSKTCSVTIAPFTVPQGQASTFSVTGIANCE